jgi:hypothetical protein
MDLRRKIATGIEKNNNQLDSFSKPKKKSKKQTVYIGNKKFLLIKQLDNFHTLHEYLTHCFDSVYALLQSSRATIDLEDSPYVVILQFLYAIAEYNNKLNFIPNGRSKPLLISEKTQELSLNYKVVSSPCVVRAECMWVDESNTIIFHEKLIKSMLNANTSDLDITVDKDIEENVTNTPECWQSATDLIFVSTLTLNKLAVLFSIAEHAAIHIFSNNHDYIQHKNWKKTNLITLSTIISIKPVGNLLNAKNLLMEQQNTRGIIFQI